VIEIVENYLTDEESTFISSIDVLKYGKKVWEVAQNSEVKVLRSNIKPYVQDILGKYDYPYSSACELLKYSVGASSFVHIDSSGSHYDSSSQHKTVTWTKTGIVILNNSFDGGELFFPNLNRSFGKEYKNCLITFPAGPDSSLYAHGVTEVTSGERYTMVLRFVE
jgi:hypothetical protein